MEKLVSRFHPQRAKLLSNQAELAVEAISFVQIRGLLQAVNQFLKFRSGNWKSIQL